MNRSGYKISIDGQQLKNKIHSCGYTVKKLGNETSRSEKTILRAIHDNEISPLLLDEISDCLGANTSDLIMQKDYTLADKVNVLIKDSLSMANVSWRQYMELDEESRKSFDGEMISSVFSIAKKYF